MITENPDDGDERQHDHVDPEGLPVQMGHRGGVPWGHLVVVARLDAGLQQDGREAHAFRDQGCDETGDKLFSRYSSSLPACRNLDPRVNIGGRRAARGGGCKDAACYYRVRTLPNTLHSPVWRNFLLCHGLECNRGINHGPCVGTPCIGTATSSSCALGIEL